MVFPWRERGGVVLSSLLDGSRIALEMAKRTRIEKTQAMALEISLTPAKGPQGEMRWPPSPFPGAKPWTFGVACCASPQGQVSFQMTNGHCKPGRISERE